MKLQLKGHDDLYAVEQLQLALFPPESREEDGAVSTLHRGKTWLSAVTEITRSGKTTRAVKRIKVADESVRSRQIPRMADPYVRRLYAAPSRGKAGWPPLCRHH